MKNLWQVGDFDSFLYREFTVIKVKNQGWSIKEIQNEDGKPLVFSGHVFATAFIDGYIVGKAERREAA